MQGSDTAVESNMMPENQTETDRLQLVLSKLLNCQEFIPEIKVGAGIPVTQSASIVISSQCVIRAARLAGKPADQYTCGADGHSR